LIDIKARRAFLIRVATASNRRTPTMGLMRKLSDSADLVNGMSQRLGIDQAACLARDPEGEARRLMQMVSRCAGCLAQGACSDLQARHDQLATCPVYCENKACFDGLTPRL
jgi:hypothetical protein